MKFAYLLLLCSVPFYAFSMENNESPEEFLKGSVNKMVACAEQAGIPTDKGLAGIFKKMQQNGPTSLFKKENEKYIKRAEDLYDALINLSVGTQTVTSNLQDKKAEFEKAKEEYATAKDTYEKHMLLCIANYLRCNCPQFKFPQTDNLAEKLASKGEAAIEDNKEILALNQDFENIPQHEEWIIVTCLLRTKIFSTLQSSD